MTRVTIGTFEGKSQEALFYAGDNFLLLECIKLQVNTYFINNYVKTAMSEAAIFDIGDNSLLEQHRSLAVTRRQLFLSSADFRDRRGMLCAVGFVERLHGPGKSIKCLGR